MKEVRSLDQDVRYYIYRNFAETTLPPKTRDVRNSLMFRLQPLKAHLKDWPDQKQSQDVFNRLGLEGGFWNLQSKI